MGRVNSNMTKVYREVVSRFMAEEEKLTHKQQVTRLYKKSLKTLESWVIDRRLWNEEATKIRAEFDTNSTLNPNSGYVFLHLNLLSVVAGTGGERFCALCEPPELVDWIGALC